MVRAESEPSSNDGSNVPSRVILVSVSEYIVSHLAYRFTYDRGENSTMLGVAQLRDQKRGSTVGNL
jgi:hypothetical protein